MKIAFFTEVFLPKVDGITNRLAHTIRELKAEGHEILIFAPCHAVEHYEGCKLVRISSLALPRYQGVRLSWPSPRILQELRAFIPDVVHVVGPACLGIWGIMASRLLELPLVASYHTDFPQYLAHYGMRLARSQAWNMIRTVHNQVQLTLCPSLYTQIELETQGIKNVSVWRGGVDTELFHMRKKSVAMRRRLTGGSSQAPLAIYVGRLGREKNLESLRPLLDAHPTLCLAFVGDGPARAELEAAYSGQRAVFTGMIHGEELASAYASADIFVMPSMTETLGFVTLEAMSCGRPVVAARAGGTSDLIIDGDNGILYDPWEPESLVAAVKTLLADRKLQLEMGRNGRRYAEQHCWSRETAKLIDNYQTVIKQALHSTHFPFGLSWKKISSEDRFS